MHSYIYLKLDALLFVDWLIGTTFIWDLTFLWGRLFMIAIILCTYSSIIRFWLCKISSVYWFFTFYFIVNGFSTVYLSSYLCIIDDLFQLLRPFYSPGYEAYYLDYFVRFLWVWDKAGNTFNCLLRGSYWVVSEARYCTNVRYLDVHNSIYYSFSSSLFSFTFTLKLLFLF